MSLRDTYLEKKELIASNLTDKGVEADSSMGLTTLANKILDVEGSDNLYNGSTNISVRAVWEDYDNDKMIRPENLKVALKGTDESYRIITLNLSNRWQYTFTDIPQTYNGQNITYTVDTIEIPDYRLSITGDQFQGYIITNTLLTGNLTVRAAINGVPEGTDLSNLRINIRGPDSSTPCTISGQMANEGYTLTNLLEGEYSVICSRFDIDGIHLLGDSVLGFSVTVVDGGDSFANLFLSYSGDEEDELQEITCNLIWDDNRNKDGNRPSSTTVRLYANGAQVTYATIMEATGWRYTFTDLPVYDDEGVKINYTFGIDSIGLYFTTFNGYNIIANYNPEITSATVRKIWNDNDNAQSIRPPSIAMTLSNGQIIMLNDANNWTATITDLPVILNGTPVTYTWEEQAVVGYTLTNVTVNETVTTFTNALSSGTAPPEEKPPKK